MPDMNDVIEEEELEEPTTLTEEDNEEELDRIDGSIVIDFNMLKDDVIMQSKDVAGICGVSAQIVRNLLKQWAPILEVKRDDKDRALWTKADIGKLQELLEVKKKHGFTVKQVLDYYLNPTPEMVKEGFTSVIPAGFDKNTLDAFLTKVTAAVTTAVEQKFDEKMTELKDEIRELKEQTRLPDESALQEAKAALEDLKAKDAAKDQEIQQLKSQNEEKARKEQDLQEENERLKAEVDTLSRRKPLFGLWKKG